MEACLALVAKGLQAWVRITYTCSIAAVEAPTVWWAVAIIIARNAANPLLKVMPKM